MSESDNSHKAGLTSALNDGHAELGSAAYAQLFIDDRPLLDLRAPAEFARGSFPNAINIPLLSDEERAAVGTRYKQQGQQAAIELGHQLISGDTRTARLAGWSDFAAQHPDAALYCWRGGLRSRLTQQALAEAGYAVPRVAGGYKALRRYLMGIIDDFCQRGELIIIGGRTGSGKTLALQQLSSCIDLEGLARHRGSTFGHQLQEQPTQISFENSLAIAILKLQARLPQEFSTAVFLEDEGRLIGRLSLPLELKNRMQLSPLVIIEEDIERRLDLIINDYIAHNLREYQQAYGDQALQKFRLYVEDRFMRIRKRLGGERHQQLQTAVSTAFTAQARDDDPQHHRAWVKQLLEEYYDPMYDYQLSKKAGSVLFRGSREAVIDWARDYALRHDPMAAAPGAQPQQAGK